MSNIDRFDADIEDLREMLICHSHTQVGSSYPKTALDNWNRIAKKKPHINKMARDIVRKLAKARKVVKVSS